MKYGGLRFLEAAHVKDSLACLRWAENPRDSLAVFRVAQLLPGFGPRHAERVCQAMLSADGAPASTLANLSPPRAAAEDWPRLVELFARLR